MGPMIVPALAVVFLSETIEPLAIGGIAAILGGIYTISWWGNFHQVLRRPLLFLSSAGMRYTMLIWLTITTNIIVVKEGIGHVQPLLYMYFLTAGSALTLTAYILARKGIAAVETEWLENALPIAVAGLGRSASSSA